MHRVSPEGGPGEGAMRPLARASETLLEAIRQCEERPGTPLPGVRELSRTAGVSHVTMARAVAEARDKGLVVTHPGRGTFVARDHGSLRSFPPPRSPQPKLLWQRVASRLRSDMLDRTLSPDRSLPTSKELCARYHVSAPTMRKVLSYLADTGELEPTGGGYAPSSRSRATRSAYVCLMARASPIRPYQSLTERNMSLLREIEDECNARGIRLELEIVDYDPHNRLEPKVAFRRMPMLHEGALFLGFLIIGTAIDPLNTSRMIKQCLDTGHRVCFFDDDLRRNPDGFVRSSRLRTISLGGDSSSGLAVGRHLLKLGHRRMAFLYQSPLPVWAADRLQGMRDAYAEAGLPADVTPFRVSRSFSEPVDSAALMRRAIEQLEPGSARDALRRTLYRLLHPLTTIWWDENQRERFERHMDALLAHEDRTAWVCESDQLAIRVRDSLRIRGVDVPGRVSLAGFDDVAEAMFEGLTSYCFNLRGVARYAVDTLLSPRRPGERARRSPVVVQGYVSERGSTGAVGHMG
ncbi:MAG: GntR family transcriptional regulator [Chitinivibrionales bacterium]|nr:GntR family transcriptional regulator [Chitinivibrionales bacterium]